MNKKTLFTISFVFLLGFMIGSFTPVKSGSAASNVVLASVEWVTNQINPLKTKVDRLEADVKELRQSLENGNPTSVTIKSTTTVHRSADATERVVATLKTGTTVKYVDSFTNRKTGQLWYNVELSTGLRGWVQASYGEVK